jgi:hypothetical protein
LTSGAAGTIILAAAASGIATEGRLLKEDGRLQLLMNAEETIVEQSKVAGVRLYRLPVVSDSRGRLSYGEHGAQLPFTPRRYFIVYDVPGAVERGGHAHRTVHQFLVCVAGSCSVAVDDGLNREEIILDSPSRGLYLPPLVWATQRDYSPGAALLVLASDVYNEAEYVRDYDEFLGAIRR